MFTSVFLQQKLQSIGITKGLELLEATVSAYSSPAREDLTHDSEFLISDGLYLFGGRPFKDNLFTLTLKEGATTTALTFEHFDFKTNPDFPSQTADVAIDTKETVIKLLNPLTPTQTIEFKGFRVDVDGVINAEIMEDTMRNPVTSVQKGPITMKIGSRLAAAKEYEELKAMRGETIKQIDVTRRTTGIVKGRRRL